MRRASILIVLALSLMLGAWQPAVTGAAGEWAIYFSPKGGCTQAIVDEVNKAKDTLLVQAYSFTSHPITSALVDAHTRGVKVKVILDKSANLTKDFQPGKYSTITSLVIAGIPTWIDAKHSIAHNKIMIIDGKEVITGSFNFTKNAEEDNAENLLIIHDPALAARYVTNWQNHAEHSQPYQKTD